MGCMGLSFLYDGLSFLYNWHRSLFKSAVKYARHSHVNIKSTSRNSRSCAEQKNNLKQHELAGEGNDNAEKA